MKKNTTRQKLSLTTKLFMCGAACYLAALFYNITQYENSMSSVSSSIGLVANEDATEKARRFEKYNYVPPVFRDNLAVKKEHEKVVEEKCGAGPEFTNYFSISPGWKERSRHNEDSILYNLFFKDRRIEDKGTFIEMGAYDGIQESNSRFFEYCLGWRGLLVEANPYEYPLLYKNRPHAHKMGFAPSCSLEEEKIGKTIMFHDIASTNAGLEGAATTYNGRHKVPVPCGSLTPVWLANLTYLNFVAFMMCASFFISVYIIGVVSLCFLHYFHDVGAS